MGNANQKIKGKIIATVVGQSKSSLPKKGTEEIKALKSSPPYSLILPKYKIIKQQKVKLDGQEIELRVKAFWPENILVEATAELDDIFGPKTLEFKDKLIDEVDKLLNKQSIEKNFSEEFTLFCISGYQGRPDQFLSFADQIAGLLKSEDAPLDQTEVYNTLASKIQYAKDDLTIVDWDGAFVFDPKGDWQDAVDLLELANIHLLRLRFLDFQLDQRLEKTVKLLEKMPRVKAREVRLALRELMGLRTQSIIEFEDAERNVKLFGDWYAARLYGLALRKFHIYEWSQAIREKLKSLEDIYTMAAENFSVTAETRAERIQIILWFVLMLGWFLLLFFEIFFAVGNK